MNRSQPSTSVLPNSCCQRRNNCPRSGDRVGGVGLVRSRGGGDIGLTKKPVTNAQAAAAGRSLLGRPKSLPGCIFIPGATAPAPTLPLPSPLVASTDDRTLRRSSNPMLDSSPNLEESTSSCLSSISSVSFMSNRKSSSFVAGFKSPSDRKNEEFKLVIDSCISHSHDDTVSISSTATAVQLSQGLRNNPQLQEKAFVPNSYSRNESSSCRLSDLKQRYERRVSANSNVLIKDITSVLQTTSLNESKEECIRKWSGRCESC